jgi:hypothetical protein
VWFIVGCLVLNTVMNLLSDHPGERFGMGAVTLVAAVSCLVAARAPVPGGCAYADVRVRRCG